MLEYVLSGAPSLDDLADELIELLQDDLAKERARAESLQAKVAELEREHETTKKAWDEQGQEGWDNAATQKARAEFLQSQLAEVQIERDQFMIASRMRPRPYADTDAGLVAQVKALQSQLAAAQEQFQMETRRTSELSQMLIKFIDHHAVIHTSGPWSRGCDTCALVLDAKALLLKPVNIDAAQGDPS